MLNERILDMTLATQKLVARLVKEMPQTMKWPEINILRSATQECLNAMQNFRREMSRIVLSAEDIAEILKKSTPPTGNGDGNGHEGGT